MRLTYSAPTSPSQFSGSALLLIQVLIKIEKENIFVFWRVKMTKCRSTCVGLPPSERMSTPRSEGAMRPSPSVSKREKASRIDATCSSLSSAFPIYLSLSLNSLLFSPFLFFKENRSGSRFACSGSSVLYFRWLVSFFWDFFFLFFLLVLRSVR